MLEHGYTVIPVNRDTTPSSAEVLQVAARDPGQGGHRRTASGNRDIMPIAEDAIAIGAKVLWQQLGVKNVEAAKKAEAAGLEAVISLASRSEHGRLFGG